MNVLVLGLQRSGMSAVCSVLQAHGFSLGLAEDSVRRGSPEPRDPFTHQELTELNDSLLSSMEWSWDSPGASPPSAPPARDELIARGRAFVDSLDRSGTSWVLEDPRMSILLPWWRQMLRDRFVPIVLVRPPVEVAWSLWLEEGLEPSLGRALWAAYYRHLAMTLIGLPVIVVDFHSLTEQPDSSIPLILEGLDRLGVDIPEPKVASEELHDIVTRHATRATTAPEAVCEDEIRQLWEAWTMGPVALLDNFSMDVPPPAQWEHGILDAHRRLRGEQALAAAAAHESSVSSARARAAEVELDELRGEAAALRDEVTALRAELAQLRPTVPEPQVETHQVDRPPGGSPASLWRAVSHSGDRVRALAVDRVRALAIRVWVIAGLLNPLFDAEWYRRTYPDVPRGRLRAWLHWRHQGRHEGRDPNPLFDTSWYLDSYPDVRTSAMDPLAHYVLHGADEDRDPGPEFDASAYLARYPDVRATRLAPLLHYRWFGEAQGRVVTARPAATPARARS